MTGEENKPREVLEPATVPAASAAVMGSVALGFIMASIIVFLLPDRINVAAGVFVLTGLAGSVLGYGNIRTRKYIFKSEKVEVYEGFLNISKNVTGSENITDVKLSRSVWQRLWGVGTVKLNTAGSDSHEIKISYIDKPEEKYREIRELTGSTE